MIAVELQAAVDAAGTLGKFYLSDARFVSAPSDTPANISFDPSINEFTTETSVYKDSQTTGPSSTSIGQLIISNTDGQYDAWLNYSFDGRDVTVRNGDPIMTYPAGFITQFTGVVQTVEVAFDTVTITLRDKQAIFDKPVNVLYYLGNNALPNGLEGVADIKGKPKPRLYGSVFNITPILVNTSKLTYQVNNGAVASIVVRDNGVALMNGGDFATSAALNAAAGLTGYVTCLAEGYFRLAAQAAGTVTADVVQGAAAADRTVSNIVQLLALAAGVPLAKISVPTFTAVAATNPAVSGVYVTDDSTFGTVMDQLSASIGMFYTFDPAGNLFAGILTAPTGVPAITFYNYDIQEDIERKPAKDNNLPVYQINVKYAKNFTVQSTVAGSVAVATAALYAQDFRAESAADTSILTQFLMADVLEVETLLAVQADAATEAARLLAMYKVRRDIFTISVALDSMSAALVLASVVSLNYNRMGLAAGRLFRLLGIGYDFSARRATLTLWG